MIDFLVVGAQKSGTTSLHRYLSTNSHLFMPESKELAFFWNEDYFHRGVDWYQQFFESNSATGRLKGEISPQYMYAKKCPERISNYSPRIKIIMCLRDPVERAYSHYRMNIELGKEFRSFEDIANVFTGRAAESDDPEKSYFGLGMYGKIVEWYLEYFDARQILVVYSDDLRSAREKVLRDICGFLGVAPDFDQEIVKREFHAAGKIKYRFVSDLMTHSSRIPNWPKFLIKSVVGEKRLYGILHKMKTEWNIDERASDSARPIDQEVLKKIRAAYHCDDEKFCQLVGRHHPWAGHSL